MPNYNPTTEPGQTRNRIWRINLDNKLNETPQVTLHEQAVIQLQDGAEVPLQPTRTMSPVFNPEQKFEIRDPENDKPVGQSATQGQLFALLYSFCRDAQEQADKSDK